MNLKRKNFRIRGKPIFKFGIIIFSLSLLSKLLSFIDIEDGLSKLINNPEISGSIIKYELFHNIPSVTACDVLSSQLPLIASKKVEASEIIFTPWQLKSDSSETSEVKPLSVNPTSPKGYVNLDKLFLKNDSSKEIDLNYYLNADMPFNIKNSGVQVLIVHTHGSEAYQPAGDDIYTPDDVDRTMDTKYNVVRIGDEIESILKANGISVIHDRNIYDHPTYNGSYTRTLDAISQHMKKNPGIKVILDIHRDSICTDDGTKYKTVAEVNGEECAQLMLVLSTGESGLPHDKWQENLKFGVKLQYQIANKYPGLMRPINLRRERFNMHVTTGSLLVEVGSSGNTLQEALRAIRPFSEELSKLLLDTKK